MAPKQICSKQVSCKLLCRNKRFENIEHEETAQECFLGDAGAKPNIGCCGQIKLPQHDSYTLIREKRRLVVWPSG